MNDIFRLIEAIDFAALRHRQQCRKDAAASPYINHPIAVMRVLAVEGGVTDVDVLIAAVLHDTVEDTGLSECELRERFGDRVADVVLEVTDDKSLTKEQRKENQVVHAPNKSADATLIKLADKICNVRDIANAPPVDWGPERLRGYVHWAQRVVSRLPRVNVLLLDAFDDAVRRAV